MKKFNEVRLRRIAYLLLLKRHNYPGVKEWELEKYLGNKYEEYVHAFDEYIRPLGFRVRKVELKEDDHLVKYYFISPIRELLPQGLKPHKWSIDEKAVLAISISLLLTSKDLKVKRREIEELASTKIPEWKVKRFLNKFIKEGYLKEEGDIIKIGMRTIFEIDIKRFSTLLLSSHGESSSRDSLDSSQG